MLNEKLLDNDLISVQETRTLVKKAYDAQKEYEKLDQKETDKIVASIVNALKAHTQSLAKLAYETTGFGKWEDKEIKNKIASEILYESIKDIKTKGIIHRDEVNKIYELAVPFGVIAGIVPTTNPTSTVIFKSIIALKSGNAIVFSPHPRALECILKTVDIIREELRLSGVSEDLVSCLPIPTIEATNALMKDDKVSLILATGGGPMVKAAYSAGKAALGVGPGNVPAFIERSADVAKSVRNIFASKTFDNGTICASEQAILADKPILNIIKDECKKNGGYFLQGEEVQKVLGILITPNDGFNPAIVGQNGFTLAKLAGITVPETTTVLIAETDGVGKKYPFSIEKLTGILAFYEVDGLEEAKKRALELLEFGGLGHTCVIHSQDEKIIENFSLAMPVSRMLVNTPTSQGAVGFTTGLKPSFTLGCGPYGKTATTDNITVTHLFNRKRISYGIKDVSSNEVKNTSNMSNANSISIDEKYIEEIYQNVMKLINK